MLEKNRLLSGIVNCLRQHEGHLVSTDVLIDWLWGLDPDGGPNTAISCIRVGVNDLRTMGFPIQVQWGRGYRYAPTQLLPQQKQNNRAVVSMDSTVRKIYSPGQWERMRQTRRDHTFCAPDWGILYDERLRYAEKVLIDANR